MLQCDEPPSANEAARSDAWWDVHSLRVFAAYLIFQGSAGALWWGSLLAWPASRAWFMPEAAPDWTLLSFWLADLLLFVCASWMSGILLLRQSCWARPLLWFTAGAVSYAALYCVGQSILTRSAWLSVVAMLPAMAITVGICLRYEVQCRP